MAPSDETVDQQGVVLRGSRGTNFLGTALFFGLRAADPFLQYQILKYNAGKAFIERVGGTVLPGGPPWITNTVLDRLALSPYRSIILAMSIGSMLKQNIHLTTIMQEQMTPASGAIVGIFNAVFNSANSLLFICSQTSASVNGEHFPQTPLIVGASLYAVGLFVEFFAEAQRAIWKKDPANKGKVYDGGLFGLSRHINYFGYTMWRSGYALASGGWIWGAFVMGFFAYDFTTRAIPDLQKYMEKRYGEQYEQYERSVPYKFAPFIW